MNKERESVSIKVILPEDKYKWLCLDCGSEDVEEQTWSSINDYIIINRQTYGKFRENNPHWEKEIPVNFIINDYENKIKAEKIKQLEWMRMIKKDEAQEKLRQKDKRFLQEKEHNKKHRTGPVLGGELGSAPKYIVPEDKE